MSELMLPIPFKELMTWVSTEYQNKGSIFGVRKPYIACLSSMKRSKLPLVPLPAPTLRSH